MRIVWQRDGKHMMSSTALLAELISDGHATTGTLNLLLKCGGNQMIKDMILTGALRSIYSLGRLVNYSQHFLNTYKVEFNYHKGPVDENPRPGLSGVPFWENSQVKRHAFSVRFSHPLSSSHFRQYFSSSSTSHYTMNCLLFTDLSFISHSIN